MSKRRESGKTKWRNGIEFCSCAREPTASGARVVDVRNPRNDGCRQLPFTAGLACFFAFGRGKARVAIEWNGTSALAWNEIILVALMVRVLLNIFLKQMLLRGGNATGL